MTQYIVALFSGGGKIKVLLININFMEKIPQNQTDVPVAETKAEELKLEWGPELGNMTWNGCVNVIDMLNKSLSKGVKPWRLPTKDELIAEYKKTNSTPAGFQSDYYWSSDTYPNSGNGNDAYIVGMKKGDAGPYGKGRELHHIYCRCVR